MLKKAINEKKKCRNNAKKFNWRQKMSSIKDDIVQNESAFDGVLHRENFHVNMDLFHTCPRYRNLIDSVCRHLTYLLHAKYEDYQTIKGVSGANAGIPFKIIAIKIDTNHSTIPDGFIVMINPTIISRSGLTSRASNCGSLLLKKPISVPRFENVTVAYFNSRGTREIQSFSGKLASTIQHEVDHTNGILITDAAKRNTVFYHDIIR